MNRPVLLRRWLRHVQRRYEPWKDSEVETETFRYEPGLTERMIRLSFMVIDYDTERQSSACERAFGDDSRVTIEYDGDRVTDVKVTRLYEEPWRASFRYEGARAADARFHLPRPACLQTML